MIWIVDEGLLDMCVCVYVCMCGGVCVFEGREVRVEPGIGRGGCVDYRLQIARYANHIMHLPA